VSSGLLEDIAAAKHPGAATAATVAHPGILDELRAAVDLLDRDADAILQSAQKGFDMFGLLTHRDTHPCNGVHLPA
jgi:hypothetical protein